MKIIEKIERECCDAQKGDFKPYKGVEALANKTMYFCVHCGQVWREESYIDEAGARDTRFVKVYPERYNRKENVENL